jgi:hypothetical protein
MTDAVERAAEVRHYRIEYRDSQGRRCVDHLHSQSDPIITDAMRRPVNPLSDADRVLHAADAQADAFDDYYDHHFCNETVWNHYLSKCRDTVAAVRARREAVS